MSKVDLSIIIPYYNGEQHIEQTIDCLLKISAEKEIIIVNDGSNEKSTSYIHNRYKYNQMIHVYTKENGGIASARNYGLNKVKGKYILFVDQDDIPISKTIDYAFNIISKADADMLLWTIQRLDEGGTISPFIKVHTTSLIDSGEIVKELIPTLLYREDGKYISGLGEVWGGLFSSEFVKKYRLNFKKFVDYEDDNIFVFDSLVNARRVQLIEDVGYIYRVWNSSYSNSYRYYTNYYERLTSLYNYFAEQYSTICPDKTDIIKYKKYIKQAILIMLLRNYAIQKKDEDWTIIQQLMTEYSEAFNGKFLLKRSKFSMFAFYAIKYRFPKIAVLVFRLFHMKRSNH